ncbi:hypothetical protein HMPREF1048_0440 [Streptococcus mitis SK575]|uniref:Uncharacterized protein n=1 Tax=Streptococcus mitis SK575 TaxID=1095736 RepID=I0SR73_STRMT|nr:hypothetical protein [Streptococcus mitis]EID25876.1 hypothetical protein HMPREF1048_0440 [Streptococcus mitis SK575]
MSQNGLFDFTTLFIIFNLVLLALAAGQDTSGRGDINKSGENYISSSPLLRF